jgi:hypothetical protein
MKREAARVVRDGLLALRHDPYMMHQANLRIEADGCAAATRPCPGQGEGGPARAGPRRGALYEGAGPRARSVQRWRAPPSARGAAHPLARPLCSPPPA